MDDVEYIIYCRKSTEENTDKQTQSIPDQIRCCMDYAEKNNADPAFDDLAIMDSEERIHKIHAFIFHAERIMGAEEGTLREPIMRIFLK